MSYLKLARLHQPIGIWLLFLPCLFGILLAFKRLPEPDLLELVKTTFLFFLGAIIMRSAGCVVNDLIDQKFDRQVARTKTRPLANKEISTFGAIIFLTVLLIFGLVILLQFNYKTIVSGFVALALLSFYPLTKRLTNYPQLCLGFTFNFGVLMSSLAITNSIDSGAVLLYIATIIWTIIYDSFYAFQDIEDDLKIGIKSTAIKFEKNPRRILGGLNLIMFLIFLLLGWKYDFRSGYFLMILLSSFFIDYKIQSCDFKNPSSCLVAFKSNIWVGFMFSFAILIA